MTAKAWEEANKLAAKFSGAEANLVSYTREVIYVSGGSKQISTFMVDLAKAKIPFRISDFSFGDRVLVSIISDDTAININGLHLCHRKLESQLEELTAIIKSINDE